MTPETNKETAPERLSAEWHARRMTSWADNMEALIEGAIIPSPEEAALEVERRRSIASHLRRLGEVEALLREAEWVASGGCEGEYACCPWCSGFCSGGGMMDRREFRWWRKSDLDAWLGHRPDCSFVALTKEAPDGE